MSTPIRESTSAGKSLFAVSDGFATLLGNFALVNYAIKKRPRRAFGKRPPAPRKLNTARDPWHFSQDMGRSPEEQ